MNIGSASQPTDFALDVLGRYVCNTFDEALANSDPVFRAAAQLPPRGDMRPFDFIVIGGGTSARRSRNNSGSAAPAGRTHPRP